MIQKQLPRQRDFSAGELVEYAKRRDDEQLVRAGARQMSDWRIMATGSLEQRPGRRALFSERARVDEVRMSPSTAYKLCFSSGTLKIRNAANTVVLTQTGLPWTTDTDQIVWDRAKRDVVICFPGMKPKVARWDGATTWTWMDYDVSVSTGGVRRGPFTRLSPLGVTMKPAATTGIGIACEFSAGMDLTASHVGTRLRFIGRQVQIATVVDATHATIDIKEPLAPGQILTFSVDPSAAFNLGEEVQGKTSQAKGYVTAVNAGAKTITVQLLSAEASQTVGTGASPPTISYGFSNSETVIGPNGALAITSSGTSTTVPQAVPFWDDEVMNSFRGWPRSVTYDRQRLTFCDFPAIPEGIAYSQIGDPFDLYPGAQADEPMFEFAPRSARVLHVMGGADQIVFCDIGVFYIPISAGNPLAPGRIEFRDISADRCSGIRPVSVPEGAVYVGEGDRRLMAIVPTGQSSQPWVARDVSEMHAHLFTDLKCLAVRQGGGDYPEVYVFGLNTDGSVAIGKFNIAKEWVGWLPWNAGGGGQVEWLSALGTSVLFVTSYGGNRVVEVMDAAAYLDCQVPLNVIPAAFSGGSGALWFLANQTVIVLDGRKYLGSRSVNSSGDLVLSEGDDFSASTVVVGLKFEPTLEPFMPHAQEGSSVKQTHRRRRVPRLAIAVQNSTGFLFGAKRATAYRMGENQEGQPPLREETVRSRPLGRDFDPRIRIVKDTPGPLRILEFGPEVTV